ncbi:MAG: UPF0280 family protein [Spirochaetes bacterium]|nr:UPF0280 family protein [Spirochaetota bacterium]
MSTRVFETFRHKDALYRICSDKIQTVKDEIIKLRSELDNYITINPGFLKSLSPLRLTEDAPVIARRMADASSLFNVGPMAAVAGTIAQMSAEKAASAGSLEVIIENGGDSYFISGKTVLAAVYAGKNSISGKLAFKITPDVMPLGICSSSSRLGHSLSFGNCDIVTCFAVNNSIADAAATSVCNRINSVSDMEPILNDAMKVKGLSGIFAVKDDKIAIAGNICDIIKIDEKLLLNKITFDENSGDVKLITDFYENLN